MVRKKRRKKNSPLDEPNPEVERVIVMMDDIVDAVRAMDPMLRANVWKHWDKTTDVLRDLTNASANTKNKTKYRKEPLGGTTEGSSKTKPTETSNHQRNIVDIRPGKAMKRKTKHIVSPNQECPITEQNNRGLTPKVHTEFLVNGQKVHTESLANGPKVHTESSSSGWTVIEIEKPFILNSICGQTETSPLLTPSRRSTRKRNVTSKVQQLEEMRHVRTRRTSSLPDNQRSPPTKISNNAVMQDPKGINTSQPPKNSSGICKESDRLVVVSEVKGLNSQTPKDYDNCHHHTGTVEVQKVTRKPLKERLKVDKSLRDGAGIHALTEFIGYNASTDCKDNLGEILTGLEVAELPEKEAAAPASANAVKCRYPIVEGDTQVETAKDDAIFINVDNERLGHLITSAVQEKKVTHVSDTKSPVNESETRDSELNIEDTYKPGAHQAAAPINTQQCTQCGKHVPPTWMDFHIKSVHSKKRGTSKVPTTCDECGKVFCNRSNLKAHINLCHRGVREFICETCGKEFHSRSNLTRHIRSHTGEKPWSCLQCGATFTEKKSLDRHTLIHTGLKLYECAVCLKQLSTAWSLKQHMTQHETPEEGATGYLCDTCGKTFSSKSNLQSHQKVHLIKRPHPCSLCKRRFYAKGDLDRHMRSHTGEKPFQCQICFKRFSRLEYQREHLNAHAGVMPYSCTTCGKGFTDRSGYHKHSKRCAVRKAMIHAQELVRAAQAEDQEFVRTAQAEDQEFVNTTQPGDQEFVITAQPGDQEFVNTAQAEDQEFVSTAQAEDQEFVSTAQSGDQEFVNTVQPGDQEFVSTAQAEEQEFVSTAQPGDQEFVSTVQPKDQDLEDGSGEFEGGTEETKIVVPVQDDEEEEQVDVTSQEIVGIEFASPMLQVPQAGTANTTAPTTDQVGFIDLDPQTNELQVHQIYSSSETTGATITTAEQVIELAAGQGASTYTVLTDDNVVSGTTIADFVCQQAVPLDDDGTGVENIQGEENLQWYVEDVVNTEPWQIMADAV